MQVKPTSRPRASLAPSARPATVSMSCEPANETYASAPELTATVADLSVSRAELVTALYDFCTLSAAELVDMAPADVRFRAVVTLLDNGRLQVQQAAWTLAAMPPTDPAALAFLALCERMVDQAFDLTDPTGADCPAVVIS